MQIIPGNPKGRPCHSYFCPHRKITSSKIVAFGDSTTALRTGVVVYADRIASAYEDITVVNAGVGSNTTSLALQRFQTDVLNQSPDLVIIQFGLNDSMVDVFDEETEPRVSLEDYEENLNYFIETLCAAKIQTILMTPNPLRWTTALLNIYGEYPYDPNDERGLCVTLIDYVEAVREIAVKQRVALVDVYNAFEGSGDVEALLLDGMHPNSKGHAVISSRIFSLLQ